MRLHAESIWAVFARGDCLAMKRITRPLPLGLQILNARLCAERRKAGGEDRGG